MQWGTLPVCDILAKLIRRYHLATCLADCDDVVGNPPMEFIGCQITRLESQNVVIRVVSEGARS